jgi:hypothetical protein
MLSIDPASGGLATPGCPRVQMLPFLEGTEPTRLCPLHSGESSPPTTAMASGTSPDTEASAGGESTMPEATPTPGTATNNAFGAIGKFFGSLFGH